MWLVVRNNQTCSNFSFSSITQRRQWHPTPVLLPGKSHGQRSLVGCSPWGCYESDTTERLHFHFHALEKEMATHSSVLAWRIPGTVECDGLPSMGSHRVGHDWSDLAVAAADYAKAFDCVDHNKLWKILQEVNTRPPDLPPEKSVWRSKSNS